MKIVTALLVICCLLVGCTMTINKYKTLPTHKALYRTCGILSDEVSCWNVAASGYASIDAAIDKAYRDCELNRQLVNAPKPCRLYAIDDVIGYAESTEFVRRIEEEERRKKLEELAEKERERREGIREKYGQEFIDFEDKVRSVLNSSEKYDGLCLFATIDNFKRKEYAVYSVTLNAVFDDIKLDKSDRLNDVWNNVVFPSIKDASLFSGSKNQGIKFDINYSHRSFVKDDEMPTEEKAEFCILLSEINKLISFDITSQQLINNSFIMVN